MYVRDYNYLLSTNEKVESEGKVVLQDKAVTPSKATVQRYKAGIALMDTTAVIKHAISRYTAENSIRCSIALAALVASVHLMPTGSDNPLVQAHMKNASPSEKVITDLVQEYYGGAPGSNKFKDRILDIFKRAEALGLCLWDNKEKALIDYLACYPSMASRIVTMSNVQRVFYANGMLSKETPDDKYAYPCFDGLLATCNKEMPNGLYEKCRDILPRALTRLLNLGR